MKKRRNTYVEFVCPKCGKKVARNATYCEFCEVKFDFPYELEFCAHCHSRVSKYAKKCPKCQTSFGNKSFSTFLCIFLAIGLISSCSNNTTTTEQVVTTENINTNTKTEQEVIIQTDIEQQQQEKEEEKEQQQQEKEEEKEQQQQKKEKYPSYSIISMVNELQENAYAAKKKYKGEKVTIIGAKIEEIDSSGEYITISSVNDDFALWDEQITCYITDDKQLEFLEKVSEGEQIIVKGKITEVGDILGYRLKIKEMSYN